MLDLEYTNTYISNECNESAVTMTPTLCQVTFPFGPLTLGFAKEILRNLSYFPSGSICSFHEHMARVHWRKLLARGTILTLPRFGISAAYKEPGGRKPHHLPHHFRCEREVLKAYHRPAVWEDKPQRSYSGRNPTEWLRFDACCWTSSALALPSRNK